MLVFGGLSSGDAPQRIIQEYQPSSDTWSQLPPADWLPEAMYGMAHATIKMRMIQMVAHVWMC